LDLENPKTRIILEFIESYKSLNFSVIEKKAYFQICDLIKENNIILFGSYSKGCATKESDIDLLII